MFRLSYADWSGAEYWAALSCLLSGKVTDGDRPSRLAQVLAESYAPSKVHLTNFGHNAINIALQAFRRRAPGRHEVIVPAYICPSVVQSVVDSGLQVVLADVGDDLNLDPAKAAEAISERTLALIAPHMYGSPARIAELEELCRDAGVFLIDDAAQVVGVRQHGRLLGTFGDMGIISFAQSKTVVTGIGGSGGVLLVNNAEFNADAEYACHNLPVPRGRFGKFLDFVWNYMWHAYTGNSGYYLSRVRERLGFAGSTPAACARISNLEAAIALAQLTRLDWLQREKIRIAEIYHRALQSLGVADFPQYVPGRYLARIMLSVSDGVDLPVLRAKLKTAGLETRAGYAATVSSGIDTAKAENWSRRLLEVPCRPGMQEAEVDQICKILSATLNSTT